MVDVGEIVSAIGTVGFPIVMCLLQWWDKRTVSKENTQAISEMSTAISNNTVVLGKLLDNMN